MLFGPSRADAAETLTRDLIAVLREERATQAALLTQFIEGSKAQTALVQAQFALLTTPVAAPEVRLMTPAHEAAYERNRVMNGATPVPLFKPLSTQALLDDLARDFAAAPI